MTRSTLLRRFFWHHLKVAACFAAAVAVLSYLAVFTEFARQAGGSAHYSFGANLVLSGLKLPFVMQTCTPFIVLFASMTSLDLLNRNGELVVARVTGLSAWQFLTPFCLGSLLIGVFVSTVLNPATARAVAYSNTMERQVRDGVTATSDRETMRWLTWQSPSGLTVLGAKGLTAGDGNLTGVTVLDFDPDRTLVDRIDAKRASLQDGVWYLQDATRWRMSGQRVALAEYRIAMGVQPDSVAQQFESPDAVPVFDLPHMIFTARALGLIADGLSTRLDALIALPFLLVGMTLIAAAVSLRFARTGPSAVAALLGIAAGFGFYVISVVAVAAGSSGAVPPYVAAWAPVMAVLCLAGVSLLFTEDG